jgi:hypothetical protein
MKDSCYLTGSDHNFFTKLAYKNSIDPKVHDCTPNCTSSHKAEKQQIGLIILFTETLQGQSFFSTEILETLNRIWKPSLQSSRTRWIEGATPPAVAPIVACIPLCVNNTTMFLFSSKKPIDRLADPSVHCYSQNYILLK